MKDNIVWENDWAEYMAMEYDGEWFEYENRPVLNNFFDTWCPTNGEHTKKKINPTHEPYWKESIIKMGNKMNIKKVQAYETSDNSIFRDIKEAEEHERLLNLANFLCDILVANNIVQRDSFTKTIIKNKEEITKILFN